MKIIEVIDCPLCDGHIAVIVEDNKVTSHGVCPKCDRSYSPDHLNFAEECKALEDEYLFSLYKLSEVDVEIADFYHKLSEKGVEI
jgi:hypothetical protein